MVDFTAFVMLDCYVFATLPAFHDGSDPNGIRTRVTKVKERIFVSHSFPT